MSDTQQTVAPPEQEVEQTQQTDVQVEEEQQQSEGGDKASSGDVSTFQSMLTLNELLYEGSNQLLAVASAQAANEAKGANEAKQSLQGIKNVVEPVQARVLEQKAKLEDLIAQKATVPNAMASDQLEAAHAKNQETSRLLSDDAKKLGIKAYQGEAPKIAEEWFAVADQLYEAKQVAFDVPFAKDRGLVNETVDEARMGIDRSTVAGALLTVGDNIVTVVGHIKGAAFEATKNVLSGVFGILTGLLGIVVGVVGYLKGAKNEKILKELGTTLPDKRWREYAQAAEVRTEDAKQGAIKEIVSGLGGLALGILAVVTAASGPFALIAGLTMAVAGIAFVGIKWLLGKIRKANKIKAMARERVEDWIETVNDNQLSNEGDPTARMLLEEIAPAKFAAAVKAARASYAKKPGDGYRKHLRDQMTKTTLFGSKTFFEELSANIKQTVENERMATAREMLKAYLEGPPSIEGRLHGFFETMGLNPDSLRKDALAGKAQKSVDRIATKLEIQE